MCASHVAVVVKELTLVCNACFVKSNTALHDLPQSNHCHLIKLSRLGLVTLSLLHRKNRSGLFHELLEDLLKQSVFLSKSLSAAL